MRKYLSICMHSKSLAGFFFMAYAFTIVLPHGTTDVTDPGFYSVLFQAFFMQLFLNLGDYLYQKRVEERT